MKAAHAALRASRRHQRTALTLRYLDGLSVPEVAEHLGRSVHATETLLVRARAALRRVYEEEDGLSDPLEPAAAADRADRAPGGIRRIPGAAARGHRGAAGT